MERRPRLWDTDHPMLGIDIIVAPFHAGVRCCRVGKGPRRLLHAGLVSALHDIGADTRIVEVPAVDDFEGEVGRSFEIMRRLAACTSAAKRDGRFPLVLAGNCNASVGAFAGLGEASRSVIWFDAHPDFDTPDECISGYLDGMGVATLAGQCWRRLAGTIPDFHPISLSDLVYCGIRDFEPGQREKVEAHAIRAVYGSTVRSVNFAQELDRQLGKPNGSPLIHLDLDCLDITVGQANEYAAPGGLSVDDLTACLRLAVERELPTAMTIASFNPDLPGGDAIADAGVRAAIVVVQALA